MEIYSKKRVLEHYHSYGLEGIIKLCYMVKDNPGNYKFDKDIPVDFIKLVFNADEALNDFHLIMNKIENK